MERTVPYRIFAMGLLTFSLAFGPGSAGRAFGAHRRCTGHNITNHGEVVSGAAIKADVEIKVGANDWVELLPDQSMFLGYYCAPTNISFKVTGSDKDTHICLNPPTTNTNLYNYIRETELYVNITNIEMSAGTRRRLSTTDEKVFTRIWSRNWTLPANVGGEWRFAFEGIVDDVPCVTVVEGQDHSSSVDSSTNMSLFEATLTVPIVRKIVATKNGTVRADSDDNDVQSSTGYACRETVVLNAYSDAAGTEQDFPINPPTWKLHKVDEVGDSESDPTEYPIDIGSGKTLEYTFIYPGVYKIEARTCVPGKSMYLTVVQVKITAVPPLYFAASESWVPFRFEINGLDGAAAEITAGTVQGFLGEDLKFEQNLFLLDNPFKPENGTCDEYLTVVNEALFDNIETGGWKEPLTEAFHFKLKGVEGTVGGKDFGPCDSDLSAAMQFGDKTIEIVEIVNDPGVPGTRIKYNKPETRQHLFDNASQASFVQVGATGWYHPTWGPFPKKLENIHKRGFSDGFAGLQSANDNGYVQKSFLEDTWRFREFGQVVDARSLDRQAGVQWVVYYNAVPAGHAGNPFDRPVVGVIEKQASKVQLFPQGSGQSKILYSRSSLFPEGFHWAVAIGKSAALIPVVGPAIAKTVDAAETIANLLEKIADEIEVRSGHNDNDGAETIGWWSYSSLASHNIAWRTIGHLCRVDQGQSGSSVPLGMDRDPELQVSSTPYRMLMFTSTNVRCTSRWIRSVSIEAVLRINTPQPDLLVEWVPIQDAAGNFNKIMCED